MTAGAEIHPTAIVHRTARLAPGVRIGPHAVIGVNVTLAADVVIGTGSLLGDDALQPGSWSQAGAVVLGEGVCVAGHCRITGAVTIGAGTEIFDGCRLRGPLDIGTACQLYDNVIIGNPGQFPGQHRRGGRISIGDRVVLRESVTILQPVLTDITAVGPECYLMARTQVDHDCVLERGVKTATGVTMGGSVHVEHDAYLGMNAVLHQKMVVGAHTMIGMNGVVMRHVPPFATLINRRFTKINRRGLERLGWGEQVILAIEDFYRRGERLPEALEEPWSDAVQAFMGRIADAPFESYRGT